VSVATLHGRREASELGRLVMDLRLEAAPEGSNYLPDWPAVRTGLRALAVKQLKLLHAAGMETVVESSGIGVGRDPGLIRELATACGLEAICVTGFEDDVAVLPAFRELTAVQIADLLIAEHRDGMNRTDMPAGMLLFASGSSSPLTWDRSVRATAFAHAETLIPVLVRSGDHNVEAVRHLMAWGVDPTSMWVVGGASTSSPFHAIDELGRLGVYLGFGGTTDIVKRASLIAYAFQQVGDDRMFGCAGPEAPDQLVTALVKVGVAESQIEQMLMTPGNGLKAAGDA
jgi:predicted metal-dependent phosphotriesterase family hydrolase